jgi:hypothetical protein
LCWFWWWFLFVGAVLLKCWWAYLLWCIAGLVTSLFLHRCKNATRQDGKIEACFLKKFVKSVYVNIMVMVQNSNVCYGW